MRDERKLIMTATPQDATVRVNMPVSEDAEASYDGPVKPTSAETSDGVPAVAPDALTERSWDGPAGKCPQCGGAIAEPATLLTHAVPEPCEHPFHTVLTGDTAAVSAAAIAAVQAIDADAPTAVVTPLEVGYRLSVVKRVAEVANENVRPVAGIKALSVTVVHGADGKLAVELRVLRWRQFAAWYRALAVRNFVDLKSTLATFPPEIRVGARSLLRQLTERCHEAWTDEARTITL